MLVDEVHSIGAPALQTILTNLEDINSKLGIGATPERFDNGYVKIKNYFGNIVKECLCNSISDGIKDGYLCKYNYHNSHIELNDTELEQWKYLSKRITILRSNKNDNNENKDTLDNLIFKRSLIAQNAENKLPKALNIIENNCEKALIKIDFSFCINLEQLNKSRNNA